MVSYCHHSLENFKYIKYWNANYVRELISYSGWNLFGSTTGVMNLQGQAIVLNFFFGPIINAAKAIADKVNGMIKQFSQNFYMAVTPQIIKSYAAGDITYMRSLVLNSSRYSFLLMFIISVPIFMVMNPLLDLWLGSEQVSLEMVKFCKYTIIYSLVNVLEQPITMAVRATGNIRKYQIYVGITTLSFLPLCILLFLIGAPAYTSMILLSGVFFVALFVRIRIVAPIIQINILDYIKNVLLPLLYVVVMTIIITVIVAYTTAISKEWVFYGVVSFGVACVISLFIGLRSNERTFIKNYIKHKLFNSNHNL
jgi:O-antigen/teichoic acid export membrane protein